MHMHRILLVVLSMASLSLRAAAPAFQVFELRPVPAHATGSTEPTGVTDAGDVVGVSTSRTDIGARAVVWKANSNGTPSELDHALGPRAYAAATNGSGSVIGGALIESSRNRAVL